MIGDEYFQVRAQLGTALFSLQTLAHELHVNREVTAALEDLAASLREPFLFIAAGEAKAGKSSLIDSLFGRELCATGSAETSGDLHFLKYGSREKDVRVSERLIECQRPVFLLRDFNVLDTPGTEQTLEAQRILTEKFLPAADLVLLVFSATNPWNSSTWQILNLVPKDRFGHVAFVIQQADMRNALEIAAMITHLKQVASEKFGAAFPVFAVSATKSYLAKTSGIDKERLHSESGVDRLERYIDEEVAHGDERWGKLRAACGTCEEMLGDFAERAYAAFRVIGQREQKLFDLNLEIEDRKQQSLRQVNGALWTMSQSYERAEQRGATILHGRLSPAALGRSLFRREHWLRDFQEHIEANLSGTVTRKIERSIESFEVELNALWVGLQKMLQTNFPHEAARPAEPPKFTHERAELLAKVQNTMREQAAESGLDQRIASLARTARWEFACTIGIFAACAVAALAELWSGHRDAAGIFCAMGAIGFLGGTATSTLRRRQIRSTFAAAMLRRREDLIAHIEDFLREAIEAYYAELRVLFEPGHASIQEQRGSYEPILVRVKQLEESFGQCAEDLGLARRSE